MQLKPKRVYFFHEEMGESKRPTFVIYGDGTSKNATVLLYKSSTSSPTRRQLDQAKRIASAAVSANPSCIIEFDPSTSPGAYSWAARSMGDGLAFGLAGGEELKSGKKGDSTSGPLRERRNPKYEPKERT